MICTQFENLTPKERIDYIGKLVHLAQEDQYLFGLFNDIITDAENNGAFEKVIINPPTTSES